jgi:DNA-binding transcriptional MocR family regulator
VELEVERSSPVPIYLQISEGIKERILSGGLPEGHRLPPERHLAKALGVNRSTVFQAYRALKAEGLIGAHVGRGTAVLSKSGAGSKDTSASIMPWRQMIHAGSAKEQDPLIRDLLELSEHPDVITFAVGVPAPDLIPVARVRIIQERLLADHGSEVFLHSPTEGLTSFRETLCRHMAPRGIKTSTEEVLVTSGSQQGLALVARVFLDPGDLVIVEEPSFFGALNVFRSAQAHLVGIPADGEGMRTDILESVLARHRPKLIYTLPTFQNPSGCVMSLQRRRHLLDLACRFQVPILEDDPYWDLSYKGEALPSLKSLDRHAPVIYLSSFSKILFPGLRLGWLVAPSQVVRQLALAKQSTDLHSNTFGQWILDRFIRDGCFTDHVKTVREAYASRRDVMLETLRASAPPVLSWTEPEGGFYIWCTFSSGIPPGRLLARAARERVAYLPGAACYAEAPTDNHLRLNFTFPDPEQIREGVCRLMRALHDIEAEPRRTSGCRGGTQPIV